MTDTNTTGGKVSVTEMVVISELAPTSEEEADKLQYRKAGDIPTPELIDRAIEDREERRQIPANGGLISITVLPGDEVGQLAVNVQFEGPYGDYDLCLENQGDLLKAASTWLGELLKELGGEFDIRIVAKPCPNTDKRLPLKHAAALLERAQSQWQHGSGPVVAGGVETTIVVKP